MFIDTLISFIYNIFLPVLIKQLRSLNTDEKVIQDIEKIASATTEIFNKYKTEHRRFQAYKEEGLIVEPEEFTNNESDGTVGYYIPLSWTLKKFLEIPGSFKLLKSHLQTLYAEKTIISNFVQGEFWQEKLKKFGSEKLYVPLFMFFDDVELGNCLGAHAGSNKIGAVYFSIVGFPSYISSKLNNILVNTIFYSKDRTENGNAKVFHKVVNELNHVQTNGLAIEVDGKTEVVYFQLSLILGDNLGLNALLGFFESFNSKCPCRICKAFIDDIKSMTEEDEKLLRKEEDYEEDCAKQNQNSTGISEKCFFHRVFGFHVTLNIILDLMHDLFEGYGNVAMVKIINYLIFVKKYFDLDYLNNAIAKFNYGTNTESNKIPTIKKEHLTKKEKLKMSAAECLCLIRYFGLLVGNKVPVDDQMWLFYLQLRQIVDYVTSPRLVEGYYHTFANLYV